VSTVVLVPRAADQGRRDAIWALLRDDYWPRLPYPVIEGGCEGSFNRAAAINQASRATGWDVAVIADADTYLDPKGVIRAVRAAQAHRLVVTHHVWRNVTEKATVAMLAAGTLDFAPICDQARHGSSAVSGIIVVTRALWEMVEGFDEGFTSYGLEDLAFARACELATGEILREAGTALHLNHPRSRRVVGDGLGRYRRYQRSRDLADVLAIRG
jgi:hypothetical protein